MFFTVTPCDECIFRVRLYATGNEHMLMNVTDIENRSKCVLDFDARKKWRSKYPGACALEYESIIQIVLNVMIGWDDKQKCGKKGILEYH